MKPLFLFFALCCLHQSFAQTASQPRLFGEGVISTGDYDSHPAFSPSGDTLYFIKCSYDLKISAICVSYRRNGRWSTPEVASFSGRYMDADPFVSRDGRTIYFMSDRPAQGNGPSKTDTDIWKVTRSGNSWSDPVRLDAPVNSESDEYYPTIADDGTIYFGSPRKGGHGGSDIYRCRWQDGHYLPAENLGDSINTAGNEYEAFISPDGSFLVYNGTPGGLAGLDFYISYNHNGQWTRAQKLPEPLSSDGIDWSPKITRDGKLFYFSSTRNAWTQPAKPLTIQALNNRLRGAGNGLADIYTIELKEGSFPLSH